MATIMWEIDVEDSDTDIVQGDSLETKALKHAKCIREKYFDEDWTFTVFIENDNGNEVEFQVDLETDVVIRIQTFLKKKEV